MWRKKKTILCFWWQRNVKINHQINPQQMKLNFQTGLFLPMTLEVIHHTSAVRKYSLLTLHSFSWYFLGKTIFYEKIFTLKKFQRRFHKRRIFPSNRCLFGKHFEVRTYKWESYPNLWNWFSLIMILFLVSVSRQSFSNLYKSWYYRKSFECKDL